MATHRAVPAVQRKKALARAQSDEEARQAWDEHRRAEENERAKTAQLRAARLAREAGGAQANRTARESGETSG